VLAAIPVESAAGLRLRALVLAYLLTGRRRSEVLNLRWRDLDLEGGFYRYTGKGGKERQAASLSIGPEGPVSLPRDSSETLALLVSRGLLCAERDDHALGHPLVYRPTPRLLQLIGVETLEEARARMRGASRLAEPTSETEQPSIAGPESLGPR
jgi:hypothetical protein